MLLIAVSAMIAFILLTIANGQMLNFSDNMVCVPSALFAASGCCN
jgi:hypothetical protein